MIKRIFCWSYLIHVLTALAVVSVIMSTWVVVQYAHQQASREQDRIEADLATCERINVLRRQFISFGKDVHIALDGVVNGAIPRENMSPQAVELRGRIDPFLEELKADVEGIESTDCVEVTPGVENKKQGS